MQINKQSFLGEALYRLSVYEKGRCNPNKICWTKRYITQLIDSINFMEEMIQSLSDESVSLGDDEIVKKCMDYREAFSFNKRLLAQWKESNYALSSSCNLKSYKPVNRLMRKITEQLRQAVKSLDKKNKMNIWYLLQALHNLPKVYLNFCQESVFDCPSSPITIDIALECAQNYLKMVK